MIVLVFSFFFPSTKETRCFSTRNVCFFYNELVGQNKFNEFEKPNILCFCLFLYIWINVMIDCTCLLFKILLKIYFFSYRDSVNLSVNLMCELYTYALIIFEQLGLKICFKSLDYQIGATF